MSLVERAKAWWAELDEDVELAFYDDLAVVGAEVEPGTFLDLRAQVQPHDLDALPGDLGERVAAALAELSRLGTHREWFELEYGATSGPLAAFLDDVATYQGRRLSGLTYVGGAHLCDFTGALGDAYENVRLRDGEELDGQAHAPLCCLYPRAGSEALYCTLQVSLPDGTAPVWLVEPSGAPERVADDLPAFLARLTAE